MSLIRMSLMSSRGLRVDAARIVSCGGGADGAAVGCGQHAVQGADSVSLNYSATPSNISVDCVAGCATTEAASA